MNRNRIVFGLGLVTSGLMIAFLSRPSAQAPAQGGELVAEQAPAVSAHPRYESFEGFGDAERSALGPAKSAAVLDAANTVGCPCGCPKGTIAQCRHEDSKCGVSRGLMARLVQIAKSAEPTVDAVTLQTRLEAEMKAQMEAQAKAQEQAMQAERERERRVFSVPLGDSPWKGAQLAKVTVVVFSEFQCPFCAKVSPTLYQLVKAYPEEVKIVFKHYPVHESAIPLAEAAIEAQHQNKFWELHDKIFQNMRAANRSNVELWAKDLGMDVEALKAALDSGKHKAALEADTRLGQDLGVNSTPTLFVNGRTVAGAMPYEYFQAKVEEERARAQKLLDSGVTPDKLYDELTKPGLLPET